MKEFKRITTPLKYSHNMEYLFHPKEKSHLVISCKNKRKNFYSTTNPPNWSDSYLASISWKKTSKYLGDYFTINPNSKFPAWSNEKSSFSDLGLSPSIVEALHKNQFLKPTNIQKMAIPSILQGFNTIIGGETGGGKTLAYGSPILNSIFSEDSEITTSISPKSLIIAPSWDLCHQITHLMSSVGKHLGISSHLLNSIKDISVKSDVIISTPHTMSSALKSKDISTDKLKSLIMDEADFLLGTNFSDAIINILSQITIQSTQPVEGFPVGSQVILCNATIPPLIEEVFGKFVPLETFNRIKLDAMHHLIPSVSHKFIRSNKLQKSMLLITLLKQKGLNSNPPTIIFCNKNETMKIVSNMLHENGVDHVVVSKNIKIETRVDNFHRFQTGESNVMLCTDLASRGLDTTRADQVINYEFPALISDYLHRAGRVGRVGSVGGGKVINIISNIHEVNAVRIIEKSIRFGKELPIIDSWGAPL